MKTIPLTKGQFAMVDDGDYPLLSTIKWCAEEKKNTFYALNSKIGKMDRFIMGASMPFLVDHIDLNGLNNQKSNLRICTKQQNAWNQRKKKPGTSKYKGVYWKACRNKWIARMRINGKTTHLGGFSNEREAARRYDEAAKKHFGKFANLNFI